MHLKMCVLSISYVNLHEVRTEKSGTAVSNILNISAFWTPFCMFSIMIGRVIVCGLGFLIVTMVAEWFLQGTLSPVHCGFRHS